MFKDVNVLSEIELHARNEVKWEIYTKKIQIESRVLGDLSLNHIIPVVIRYQTMLLENVARIQQIYGEDFKAMASEPMRLIEKIAGHINSVNSLVYEMVETRKTANVIEDAREKAIAYHDTVLPFLGDIRKHIDDLELMVDNQMWPLPKYRELLFIR